jgi:hypothetical protein
VRVRGDGTITYKGVSGVAQVGERHATISWQSTRRLFLRFGAADFFALPQSTTQGSVELPATCVTLLVNGKVKRLERQGLVPSSSVSASQADKLLGVLGVCATDIEPRWTGVPRLDRMNGHGIDL